MPAGSTPARGGSRGARSRFGSRKCWRGCSRTWGPTARRSPPAGTACWPGGSLARTPAGCVFARRPPSCAGLRDLLALQAAVEELHTAYGERYPSRRLHACATDLRQRLLAAASDRLDPASEPTRRLLGEIAGLQREALVNENPLLKGKKLLLVKRYTYDSNHFYDEFASGIRRFGGGFYLLSLPGGAIAEIAPELHSGVVGRYDVSFDARRILFDYRPCKLEGFRIHEIGVDGKGLRAVTAAPADEGRRMATYSEIPAEDLRKPACGCGHLTFDLHSCYLPDGRVEFTAPCCYGHWTDDLHPCYLPDGRIVFASTRSEHGVLCSGHGISGTNLYRINADGTGLQRLSENALSEFFPTGDERRADTLHPLGIRGQRGGSRAVAVGDVPRRQPLGGDRRHCHERPARVQPGPRRARPQRPDRLSRRGPFALQHRRDPAAGPAAGEAVGSGDDRADAGFAPQGELGAAADANGRWTIDVYGPWYADPFPLTDPAATSVAGKFFLVSCNEDKLWNDPAAYGLYLLDVFGNRVPIYRDAAISCWQPRPLEPQPVPPVAAGSSSIADSSAAASAPEATVVVADVYQGLEGVPRGTVKYLRVMEQYGQRQTWPALEKRFGARKHEIEMQAHGRQQHRRHHKHRRQHRLRHDAHHR